ncbi:MAG: sensor histidine kinase [Clostridium sp.]|nr:sensor histidine kinase [Clostridium sp.]
MRENMDGAFEIVLVFFQVVIIKKYLKVFLGINCNYCRQLIGWVIYFVFLIVGQVFHIYSSSSLIIGNIVFILLILLISNRKKIFKNIIFSILLCFGWLLIEGIVGIIINFLEIENEIMQKIGSFISEIIMLWVVYSFDYIKREKNHGKMKIQYWLGMVFMPIGSVCIMYQIFLLSLYNAQYVIMSAITAIFLLGINYIMYELCGSLERETEVMTQARLYEQQLVLYNEEAKEREQEYFRYRKIRHDMKNHLIGLRSLIKEGDVQRAENYLDGLLDDIEIVEEKICSGNVVVDTLVNAKYTLAKKMHIKTDIQVCIPNEFKFQDKHLMVILGNIIDNAIEASMKLPEEERYIKLIILYQKKMLNILIINNYNGRTRKNRWGEFITTKEEQVYHGLGLSAIKQAIDYYNGEVKITEKNGKFQVSILIYENNIKIPGNYLPVS